MDDELAAVSDFLDQKFGCSACPRRFSTTHDFDSHKCSPKIRCNGYIHSKACAAAPFNTMDEFLDHFKQKHIRKTACMICCMKFDEEKLRTHPITEHAEEVPRSVQRFMTVPEEHKKKPASKPQSVANPPACTTAAVPSTSTSTAAASSAVAVKPTAPCNAAAPTRAVQVPSTSTPVRPSPVPADPSPSVSQQSPPDVKPAAAIFRPFSIEATPSTCSAAKQPAILKPLTTPAAEACPPLHPAAAVAWSAFSTPPAAAAAAATLAWKPSACVGPFCAAAASTSAAPVKISAAAFATFAAAPDFAAAAAALESTTSGGTSAPAATVQPTRSTDAASSSAKPVVAAKTVARFAYAATPAAAAAATLECTASAVVDSLSAPAAPAKISPTPAPVIATPPALQAAAPTAETVKADAKTLKTVAKLVKKMVDSIVRREEDMKRDAEIRAEGLKRKAEESSHAMPTKRARIDGTIAAFPWTNSSDEAMEVSTISGDQTSSSVHLTPPNTISPVPVASSVQQPKQSESPHSGATLPAEETASSSSVASSAATRHPPPEQTPFTISPFAMDFFRNRPHGVLPQSLPPTLPAPILPPCEKAIKEEAIDRADAIAPLARASSSSSSGPPALSPQAPPKQPDLRIEEVVDEVDRAPTPPLAPLHEVKREPVEEPPAEYQNQPLALPPQQQSPAAFPIVQHLPASPIVFNKALLEQGQARRASSSQPRNQAQPLIRVPTTPTQPRIQAPPQPAGQVQPAAPLREIKEEPMDVAEAQAPVVAAVTAKVSNDPRVVASAFNNFLEKYPDEKRKLLQQLTGPPAAASVVPAAVTLEQPRIESTVKDHQFCRPDEASAPSTSAQLSSVQVPIDMDHPYSKHVDASTPSTSGQPTSSRGPIEQDHAYSKPVEASIPSTSAQSSTIHAEAPLAVEIDDELHVREGSFDSVPITPADRLQLAPIPPYKSPRDVKEEPVDASPEPVAAPEISRVIERADFASFFSGFKELARGVQQRIEAAEARARELRRLVPMGDVFDDGIDQGAAAGVADQPPSQAADEEHEPATPIEDTDDPMEDGPSTSGMVNGAADDDHCSAASEGSAEEDERMDEVSAQDPTENGPGPSTSRSVTPLRITRRSPRKHTGDHSTSNEVPAEEIEHMNQASAHDPTENRPRSSTSRSITPLRITRRSPRKHAGDDDSMSGEGRSTNIVTPRSCLKTRKSSPRRSKMHIHFPDEPMPANEAREGYNGQFPEEHANEPSENGSSVRSDSPSLIITRSSLRAPKLEATVKQEHPSPRVQSPINWDQEYEMTDKKDIQRVRERRSRSVKAEPMEEEREKNEHEKFWCGESEAKDCPQCNEKISQNLSVRMMHYKKMHYDIFFAGDVSRMSTENWMCWKLGPQTSHHESDKDGRACLLCPLRWRDSRHRGRVELVKHMKHEHKPEFKKLKEEYRLHQRVRKMPEDTTTHMALL